eukprot:scaffold75276_cov19-Tisochrysis_lutea.AAC.1
MTDPADKQGKFVGIAKHDLESSSNDVCVGKVQYDPGCFGGEAYFVPRNTNNPSAPCNGMLVWAGCSRTQGSLAAKGTLCAPQHQQPLRPLQRQGDLGQDLGCVCRSAGVCSCTTAARFLTLENS